jgi:hypothetical protein
MKKRIAIKYLYNVNPFYVHFKKHYCIICGTRLKTGYESKIVNSHSPEAVDYDFSISDSRLVGDVEFRRSYFLCPQCNFKIPFGEMRKFENQK